MKEAGARRGRRPDGDRSTREDILAAARGLFATVGYERASIRSIARRAGVDPALVHHYFGTKDDLLVEAIRLPVEPAAVLEAVFEHPERVGEELVRTLVGLWDTPDIGGPLQALIRAAVTHPGAAGVMRNVIARDVLKALTRHIDRPDAELRAELAMTHLIGLAMGRYIVRVEPLASTDAGTLASIVGPTLQRYLTAPAL